MLLAMAPQMRAGVASTDKDGITIAAEATVEPNGKTRITCTIANGSSYTLASVYPHSESKCFRFSLSDSNGDSCAFDKKWALQHMQPDGSNDETIDRIGLSEVFIYPSEKREFQFDLEDAYGENAVRGRVLDVKWMNYYTQPGGTITVDESKGPDGKIIPAHEELNHFPNVRTFSVSLPLPKKAGEETLLPAIDRQATPPRSEDMPLEADIIKPSPTATTAPAEVVSTPNRWWWALLVIPLAVIIRLLMRPRKQP